MSKLMKLGFTCAFSIAAAGPASGQFANYKKIEAYEVRSGILMMPRYAADGQICEIGIEPLHYSSKAIHLSSTLSRTEIDLILNEVVPAQERGKKLDDLIGSLVTRNGPGLTTTTEYEKVFIQIYGDASSSGKGAITVSEVAATVRWKNRVCQ